MSQYDKSAKRNRCSCELCNSINADSIEIERHGAILVTVRIKVNNVCMDKKVAVAAIIYDKCHRILAFKGFITMACGDSECGTIERKILFVIPEDDVCDPDELEVRTVANYIYPCEPEK
ncbi:MAG TPA: hypothetical protein VF839_08960 [Clostridium sp.]